MQQQLREQNAEAKRFFKERIHREVEKEITLLIFAA